jgi:hypothetical protein
MTASSATAGTVRLTAATTPQRCETTPPSAVTKPPAVLSSQWALSSARKPSHMLQRTGVAPQMTVTTPAGTAGQAR